MMTTSPLCTLVVGPDYLFDLPIPDYQEELKVTTGANPPVREGLAERQMSSNPSPPSEDPQDFCGSRDRRSEYPDSIMDASGLPFQPAKVFKI